MGFLGLDCAVTVQVTANGLPFCHLPAEELVVEVLVSFARELALHVDDAGVNHLVEDPPALSDLSLELVLVLLAEITLPEVLPQLLDLEVLLLHLLGELEEGAFLLVVGLDEARSVLVRPGHVAVRLHLLRDRHEVRGELPSCLIVVEAQMERCPRRRADETLHLAAGGIAARGDEDSLPEFLVRATVKLPVGHRIVSALEEENPVSILQRSAGGGGNPQAEAAVAPGGLALVRFAVASRSAPLLESHDVTFPSWNGEREGEVADHRTLPAGHIPVGQDEEIAEGVLGIQVQPTVPEERIEGLGGFPVPGYEDVNLVVLHIEGFQFGLRFLHRRFLLLVGRVQQPVADLVDELVEVHPDLVLGEEMRMLLDERDDVVVLLHRRMEAELPVPGDDELVTADPLPVLVQTDERRVTHPVLPVADIARITEDIHHGEPLHIVLISEFHISNRCYRPSPTPCSAALSPASKARLAMS